MPEAKEQEYSRQRLNELSEALSSGMFLHVRNLLADMPDYDVAWVLEATPAKARTVLWQLIDDDAHGDILEELSDEVRKGILRSMDPESVAAATEGMDTDDLSDVLRALPDRVYQQVIKSMDHQDRVRAEQAMSYGDETAGAIMNTDTVTLRPDVSIDVVLRYLRLKGDLPEGTDSLYVVDKNDKLIGTISLSALVTANPNLNVRQAIDDEHEAIPVDMPETEVAQLFERHDWLSAPVVDANGSLLGRITIDDVVDIIREEAEHSMMSMAGLDDEEDTFAPVVKSTKRRSVWLGINLLTALLAAIVSKQFEGILSQITILAILNSIVPSMGGIAGNQTLTLVIRGMALGHIGDSNSRWLIGKELAIGVLNGLLWALMIAGVVVFVWGESWSIGAVIAFAMLANMISAGLAGVSIPLILKRFKIDPALAGGVILTTITDVVGIFAFLGTATWFLSS